MANCTVCKRELTDLERPTKLCTRHYFTGHMDGTKYVADAEFSVGDALGNNSAANFIPDSANWL